MTMKIAHRVETII